MSNSEAHKQLALQHLKSHPSLWPQLLFSSSDLVPTLRIPHFSSQPQFPFLSSFSDPVPALEAPRSSFTESAISVRLPNPEACMQQAPQYYEPHPHIRSKSSFASSILPQSQPVVPQPQLIATGCNPKNQNLTLTSKVSLINSVAFNLCMRLSGSQMYKLYLFKVTQEDFNTDASPDPISIIPTEY